MDKVKIEETGVFKQVAKVLGEKQAKIELFKASKSWTEEDVKYILNGKGLISCFIWDNTPQRGYFWSEVDEGFNPYE